MFDGFPQRDLPSDPAFVDSWHFGKKRSPWTGSWANIVWKPESVNTNTAEKREAPASLRKETINLYLHAFLTSET